MAKFIGRRINLGLGKESTRGVGVAPSFWLPKISFGFDDKATVIRSGASAGNIGAGPESSHVVEQFAEGDFEGEIRDVSFGVLLSALFGAAPSSAVFSGAYKHTYTLTNSNEHASLSIGVDDPIGDLLFELAMINSLKITVLPGDLVKFVCNFVSKRSADSTLTPAYTSENKFIGKHLNFKVAADSGSLDAAALIGLKRLELNFQKNVVRDNAGGTIQPVDINNLSFNIFGSFELNYEDRVYRNYMLNGTNRALRIDVVNNDVTIGTTNPAFRIDLGVVDFEAWEPIKDNDELARQTINFNALWDLTNSRLFSDCYLVNSNAGASY